MVDDKNTAISMDAWCRTQADVPKPVYIAVTEARGAPRSAVLRKTLTT